MTGVNRNQKNPIPMTRSNSIERIKETMRELDNGILLSLKETTGGYIDQVGKSIDKLENGIALSLSKTTGGYIDQIEKSIDELKYDIALSLRETTKGYIDQIGKSTAKLENGISLSSRETTEIYIYEIEESIGKLQNRISLCVKATTESYINKIEKSMVTLENGIALSLRKTTEGYFAQIREFMVELENRILLFLRETTQCYIAQMRKFVVELENRTSLSSREIIVYLGVVVVTLLYFFRNQTPSSPVMKTDEKQNFSTYCGIIVSENHFTTTRADECRTTIIYESVLPQTVLNSDHSASSFMTLAEYGTGKTLLRCEYFRSLSSDDYLKLTILDKQVTEYLDRFVRRMHVSKMQCQTKNCLMDWSENEFAQLLLSSLVTNFINTYDSHKHNGPDLSLDEKVNLITIIFYYYNGKGTTHLEKFVNWFLNKGLSSRYKVDGEHLQRYKHHNQQLYNHLEDDLNKFSILNKNPERLSLLVAILEGERFHNRASAKHLYGEYFRDLVEFSSFIKTYFKKTPVFVIDGIDQNIHFVGNGKNRASFESFCRSSVSPSILSMVMANHFHLSLFYPKIDDVNIEDMISRKDKFPIHTISWNTKFLINYADYVLQEMNKYANETRCKEFTDFKTLVNYSNRKNAGIIDKISTPRVLHFFMQALMREMNGDASNAVEPFQATFENVDNAYEEALKSFKTKTKG